MVHCCVCARRCVCSCHVSYFDPFRNKFVTDSRFTLIYLHHHISISTDVLCVAYQFSSIIATKEMEINGS